MNSERTYDEPSAVAAEDGKVVVDGPDGVAVTLTPDAAIETSDRLLEGGMTAQGQLVEQRNEAERRAGNGARSSDAESGPV